MKLATGIKKVKAGWFEWCWTFYLGFSFAPCIATPLCHLLHFSDEWQAAAIGRWLVAAGFSASWYIFWHRRAQALKEQASGFHIKDEYPPKPTGVASMP